MIEYHTSLKKVDASNLKDFFEGWQSPHTPENHYKILENSDLVVLAIDNQSGSVVGFVNCLTDRVQSAFIPLLEVLPDYRGQQIGTELVRRMLKLIGPINAIDIACDPELQPFYKQLGMKPSVGMMIRNY